MKVLLTFLLGLILYSCTEQKKNPNIKNKEIQVQTENSKSLSIRIVGELPFRRNYGSGDPSHPYSKEEIKRIERSNPDLRSVDTSFLRKLGEFKLLDNNSCLMRSKFKTNKSKIFELISPDSIVLKCEFKRPTDSTKYNKYNLKVINGMITATSEIEGFYGYGFAEIKYLLLDIIPGNFKEIVFLNEYYIMNGDNSDIFIYEVKYD